ncbi:MAG: hypothetical protein WBP29_09655 [Candidatus Zixiibacteriota bacterium]
MLRTTTVGNYPKLPSEKGQVNIRKMLHRFDKNEVSRGELDAAYDAVTTRVIAEQASAGIDLPTDGQIRWDDIVTPLAAGLDGFKVGGLLRWFDNNVYYRKPKIAGPILWKEPATAPNFQFAQQKSARPIKAVLPAPYSFAKLCDDQHYTSQAKLLADIGSALRLEAQALITAGAKHIQFDDPWLPYHHEDAGVAIDALNTVVDGLEAEFWTCYYFSNIAKLAESLKQLQVSVIAADCVSHPGNVESLMGLSNKFICCFGIVDARNIKMEREDQLQTMLNRIAATAPNAYVSPSCGLEFLPHRDAVAKVQILARAVKAFNGEPHHA